MRFLDALSLSTRMFRTRPLRTFLTVLGVSVGIGTVLFLVSFGYGLQKVILDRIATTDSLLSLDVSSGTTDLITLSNQNIEEISQINEVEEISSVVNLSAQLNMDDLISDGMVYATDTSFFRLSGILPQYGKVFNENNSYEAVISSAGVELFDLTPEQAIGKEISLVLFLPVISQDGLENIETFERKEKYKIVGMVDDENTNYVFISKKTISDLKIEKYDQFKVKVSSNEHIERIRNEIIEKGFLVSSLSDTIDQTNKIFRVIQIILGLFGLIALIVSAIGMFNTMTIALLERINEIGIMRAVGVSKRDIRKLFLLESIIMGFLGGVGGVIIGYSGGKIANIGINILAKTLGGQSVNLFYSPQWFVIFIIIFSTVIGFVTGIYPSLKASKINPLTALRYK